MPGVALDETVNCDNPLLQFFYHENGKATDVEVLAFSINNAVGTELIASTPVDVGDDCGVLTGKRLGLGRYAADFKADSALGTPFAQGTHTIIWVYEAVTGDSPRTYRQEFEVLNPATFATGAGYRAYASSNRLLALDAFAGFSPDQMQEVLLDAAEQIEMWTDRFFEPRHLDGRFNGTSAGSLPLMDPIIGIDNVAFVTGDPFETILKIDLSSLTIFNRHLRGLDSSPDDRDNPRVEFLTEVFADSAMLQGSFEPGRLNIQVQGVFGYTDFDGTPIGRLPRQIQRLAGMMAIRLLKDPFGEDPFISASGTIKEAKTRDQSVRFFSGTEGGSGGGSGAWTGDKAMDDIIAKFIRPPYYGAVTSVERIRSPRRPNR